MVTQSSSTHLIVSSQKDDFKSLRDKMHELQNGQRALGTLEEIREEVAGQGQLSFSERELKADSEKLVLRWTISRKLWRPR